MFFFIFWKLVYVLYHSTSSFICGSINTSERVRTLFFSRIRKSSRLKREGKSPGDKRAGTVSRRFCVDTDVPVKLHFHIKLPKMPPMLQMMWRSRPLLRGAALTCRDEPWRRRILGSPDTNGVPGTSLCSTIASSPSESRNQSEDALMHLDQIEPPLF